MYGEGSKTLRSVNKEILEQTMSLGAVIVPLFGAKGYFGCSQNPAAFIQN